MKKTLLTLLISQVFIGQALANTPNTRQSNDYIFMKDENGILSVYNKTSTSTISGIKDLNGPLSQNLLGTDKVRTEGSRVTCPVPYNPHKSVDQDLFPSREWAQKWYANCMESHYVEIERDMLHSLRETGARRAFYQYIVDVKYRDLSEPSNEKTEELVYNIVMDRNMAVGEAVKSGFEFGANADNLFADNLYIKYLNGSSIDILEVVWIDHIRIPTDLDNYIVESFIPPDWRGDGLLHVYKMEGTDPKTAELELLEVVESSDFESDRVLETGEFPDDISNFFFEPYGVMNVLEYSGNLMESYGANLTIVDYGYPLSVAQKEDEDGNYSLDFEIENNAKDLNTNQPYYADRFYDRNQCTTEPVRYTQYYRLNFSMDNKRERYFLSDPNDVKNLTPSKLLNLTKISEIKPYSTTNELGFSLENYEHEDIFNRMDLFYNRSTPRSLFNNKLTAFNGKSPEPFSLSCNDPNNPDCYEANGLFKGSSEIYKNVGTYRDISIQDFDYQVREGYWDTEFVDYECTIDEETEEEICVDIYEDVYKYRWVGPGSSTSTYFNSCTQGLNKRAFNHITGESPKYEFCDRSDIRC